MSTSDAQPMFYTRRNNVDAFYMKDGYLAFSHNHAVLITTPKNSYRKCWSLKTNTINPVKITDWLYVKHATAYLTLPEHDVESYNLLDDERILALCDRLKEISISLIDNIDQFLKEAPIYIDTNPNTLGAAYTLTGRHITLPKASFYILGDDVVFCKNELSDKYRLLNPKAAYEIPLYDDVVLRNYDKGQWALFNTTSGTALSGSCSISEALHIVTKPQLERVTLDTDFLPVK